MLRALGLMNRLALSKWKAGSLETAAATEELKLRGGGCLSWEGWRYIWGTHLHLEATYLSELSRWLEQQCRLNACRTHQFCISMPIPNAVLYLSRWRVFRGNSAITAAIIAEESERLMTYRASCTWFLASFPLFCYLIWWFFIFVLQWIVCLLLTPCSPWNSQAGGQEGGQSACQTLAQKSAQGGGITFLCYCLLSWHLV